MFRLYGLLDFELKIPDLTLFYIVPEFPSTHVDATRKFPCEFCGKIFMTQQYVSKHQRMTCYGNPQSKGYGAGSKKPFSCYQCGTGYSTQSGLNFHIRRECGQVQICRLCGDTFLHYSSLKKHTPRCRSRMEKYTAPQN